MKLLELTRRRLSNGIVFFVGILLFRGSLDAIYLVFVHPVFAYAGFNLDFDFVKYLESWAILVIVSSSLSSVFRKPSDFFLLVFAIGFIAPVSSLYGLADKPRFVIYCVLIGFVLLRVASSGKPFRLPTVRNGTFIALAISWILTATVLLWIVYSGGLSYLNFNFLSVYDLRGSVGEVIGQGGFAYLNVWVFKVSNVFLFAYALHRRKWVFATAIFALQVLFFGVSALKGVLFYPLLVLAIWYYLRKSTSFAPITFGLTVVAISSTLVWWFADLAIFGSYLVRRVFFTTANNAFDYFEFFSNGSFVFWSNSITSAFIEYPYHMSPPELIGEWQGSHGSANNSFISNGYMHAGIIGLFAYCLIVGFLFRIIDSLVAYRIAPWLGLAVTVIPVWTLLLSSDLPTVLLTHGLGLSVVLLFLARSKKMASRQERSVFVWKAPAIG